MSAAVPGRETVELPVAATRAESRTFSLRDRRCMVDFAPLLSPHILFGGFGVVDRGIEASAFPCRNWEGQSGFLVSKGDLKGN